MELIRFGVVVRALRRRRGWRQSDLASAAGISQSLVSLLERGHGDRVAFGTLARVAASLDARAGIDLRWRGGELERLIDADHGVLTAGMARRLRRLGWEVRIEVTYAIYRATGSIDVLAWHPPSASLLVIEIKTEITSAEATMRRLDEKVRLAPAIAMERFGWRPHSVSRMLVVQDASTARRRIARADDLFSLQFPDRGTRLRAWLAVPTGPTSGLLFMSPSNPRGRIRKAGGRHRVRQPDGPSMGEPSSASPVDSDADGGPTGRTILTSRG
jgi:transcriptional regulator with XRE-family HTH domain